ncbi:CBS domain-containing protein [Saccharothrix variisporea]|uniref:CBS domain protein n=1 Tax=Saccharothrix variisporea TaxID=543527 RepID=A0A495XLH4_9PSEU|nr:CBS domain-containing protein [Saccharothrix variisporea]RKT74957.1 hypothetical protein DFJ66_8332 [Saccharothrix variisporea]
MKPVLLSALAGSHVVVRDDVDVVEASAASARAEADHVVVVTAEGRPVAVFDAADLAGLSGPPAGFAEGFPPVVLVGGEPDELGVEELVELADLVARTGARHVVVERDGVPVGVVPRASIAAALPLDAVDVAGVRAGNPDLPSLTFICTKCSPPRPQMPRVPGPDGGPPLCRVDFFHGPMDPVV